MAVKINEIQLKCLKLAVHSYKSCVLCDIFRLNILVSSMIYARYDLRHNYIRHFVFVILCRNLHNELK